MPDLFKNIPVLPFGLNQGEKVSGTEISAVVIAGLAVVFAALIILIILVWAYGKIFDSVNTNKKEKQSQDLAANTAKASQAAQQQSTQAQIQDAEESDEVSDESDEEVVAAISAVIAQIANEEGKQLKISSIKPSSPSRISGRSAWALEGLRQNTKPF